MKKYLVITGDVNDGDYVMCQHAITDKQIEALTPIIEAIKDYKIKNYHGCNWNIGYSSQPGPQEIYKGILTEQDIDSFSGWLPCGENGEGIHSIESITVLVVTEEIQLF
jgi:hypothetical protein